MARPEADSISVETWEGYAGKARFRLIAALGALSVRKLTVSSTKQAPRPSKAAGA